MGATYAAITETYSYLTPDLWKETVFTKSPYQEFTDFLAKNHRAAGVRSRRPWPTSQLTLDALEDEDVKTSVLFSRLTSSSAQGYLFVIFLSFSGQLKIRS